MNTLSSTALYEGKVALEDTGEENCIEYGEKEQVNNLI